MERAEIHPWVPAASHGDDRLAEPPRWLAWLAFAALLVCASALLGRYRVEDLDDAWSLSFFYEWWHHGIEGDAVFESVTGPAGVIRFGKLQAAVYAPLLDLLGWGKTQAHAISSALVAVALAAWWWILRGWGAGPLLALATVAVAGLAEPIISAANKTRPEALVLCLASLALLATRQRAFVLAGLLALLAFEVHPLGGLACTWVLCDLFVRRWRGDLLRPFAAAGCLLIGAVIGLAAYLALHLHGLAGMQRNLTGSTTGWLVPNSLTDYFLGGRLRHLPELVLFAIGLLGLVRARRWKPIAGPAACAAITWLALLFCPRSNYNYMAYGTIPAFSLLLAGCSAGALPVARSGRQAVAWVTALWLGLLAPQCLAIAYRNRANDPGGYVRFLQELTPRDDLPVVGGANEWFAFMDRRFVPATVTGRLPGDLLEFWLIEEDDFRAPPPWKEFHSDKLKATLAAWWDVERVRTARWNGEVVNLCRARRRVSIPVPSQKPGS